MSFAGSPVAAGIEGWHQNAEALCLLPPYDEAETPAQVELRDLIIGLVADLAPFPAFLRALEARPVALCLDDRTVDALGYFDLDRDLIALGEALSTEGRRAILIHELRHLEQVSRGFCPTMDLSMTANAEAVFALEADAQAVTAVIGWYLRDAGKPGVWDFLADWPSSSDIVSRFADEMHDGGTLAEAASAAFDQWYASENRVADYYLSSCSDYLDRLDSANLIPKYGNLDEDFLPRLCRLPDDGAYPCTRSDRDPR